jgi:ABC-2 type transport system permease protein
MYERRDIDMFPPLGGRYVNLAVQLAKNRFKTMEQGTVLGFIWTLTYPLLMVLILYVLFSARLGGGIEQYPLYILTGLVFWNFFNNATMHGLNGMLLARSILKNSPIPSDAVVVGEVLMKGACFALELAVLLAAAALLGPGLAPESFLVFPAAAMLVVLSIGVSFLLSWLNVLYRDVRHMWTLILRVGFFATPIFYDPGQVLDGWLLKAYMLNPVTQIIGISRDAVIRKTMPGLMPAAYVAVFTFAITVLFYLVLKRVEPRVKEEL